MKKIVYFHNTQKKNISLPVVFRKDRPKTFFFFGDSFSDLPSNNEASWTLKVCDHFNATAFNWSISGASEQSIFYTFAKTINEVRDFTFIFHTHPHRTDRFFNLKGLPMNRAFFKKWDDMLTFPCIHLYWSHYNYEFENGKTLICTYPICDNDVSAHHLTPKSNTLLANTIIDTIERLLE